ncbi:hypothetical protein BGW38_003804 [Lunasporangiospora selenospora]|uniref:Uncharacterized protein n=1 Tax=Lunasporangiospora selenospora TaxID=979761 RepID=A0A9P6FQX5_9FUNG|nr:hypothetical protein BGW38_003804 [Lunasporangiospora selenospora]
MSSNDTSSPISPEVFQRLLDRLDSLERVNEDLRSQLHLHDPNVAPKQLATTLTPYPTLLEAYPSIGCEGEGFYTAVLPPDHEEYQMSDFHLTSTMLYQAPPSHDLGDKQKHTAAVQSATKRFKPISQPNHANAKGRKYRPPQKEKSSDQGTKQEQPSRNESSSDKSQQQQRPHRHSKGRNQSRNRSSGQGNSSRESGNDQ